MTVRDRKQIQNVTSIHVPELSNFFQSSVFLAFDPGLVHWNTRRDNIAIPMSKKNVGLVNLFSGKTAPSERHQQGKLTIQMTNA